MKIIMADNFCRDEISDILIAENVHPSYINDIVDFLNQKYSSPTADEYFRAENDDYELYEGIS